MSAALRLYLIAGEPSGDRLGADLIRGLRALSDRPVELRGLGGAQMAAEGLESLFPIDELSIMGLAEVLPRVPSLLRRIAQTARDVERFAPDALITIDSPDFCLRVARRIRRQVPKLRTIHYVAPSVWAWRPGRADKMARVIDHVLALLPFEPPYMQRAGMSCDFVGHPVALEAPPTSDAIAAARRAIGLEADTHAVAILPGSRRGEVDRHGPMFRTVMERLSAPSRRFLIPTVGAREAQVREVFAGSPTQPLIVRPEQVGGSQAVFAACEAALAVSGTVSVELAAAGTPMIVGYRANRLTEMLARRLVKVDYASLVNILEDRAVIPEYLADACTVEALEGALGTLLESAEAQEAQRSAFGQAMAAMGRGRFAPGEGAARSVLDVIG